MRAGLASSSPVGGGGREAQLAVPSTASPKSLADQAASAARDDHEGHSDLSPSSLAAFSPSKRPRRGEEHAPSFLSQPSETSHSTWNSSLAGSQSLPTYTNAPRGGFSPTGSRSSPLKIHTVLSPNSREPTSTFAHAFAGGDSARPADFSNQRISAMDAPKNSPLSSRYARRAPDGANEVSSCATSFSDGKRAERIRELENLQHVLPASGALREYVQQAGEEARGKERGDRGPFSLPKSADEFRDQWKPLVDATVKKLCDMTDEEKQVTRYIMLEGRMLRAVRRASASLANRRTKAVAFNSETRDLFLREQQLYEESEREFEVVQRVAQDQAGGQEMLEKRLKDTQRKKQQVEVYRQQVHKKMATLSFTRQKKLRLFEALEAAKKESSSKEKSLQALYQLLQCTTRFKVNKVDGGLVTGALVPEQQSALFPRLRKTGENARQIKNRQGEDVLQDATAEPAILTLDCEKENRGGLDADVLWDLIEDALGVGGVPVTQLLKSVRVQ